MSLSLRWCLPALVAGLLGLTMPAGAFAAGTAFRVRDDGGMFSKEAVEKANKKIEEIKRTYNKDLLIETFNTPPDNLKKDYREEGKKQFFLDWSKRRYKSEDVRGVYVLICKKPQYLQVIMGEETAKKAFTTANQTALSKEMIADLKAEKPDKALLDAVEYVASTFEKNGVKPSPSGPSARRRVPAPAWSKRSRAAESGAGSASGWSCCSACGCCSV